MSMSFANWSIKRVSLLVYLVSVVVLALSCLYGRIPMNLARGVAWIVILWDAAYISIAVMLVGVPLKRFLGASYCEFLKRI